MAKNKKSKGAQQKPFNEKTYIRTKMRSLPIDKCYEVGDVDDSGLVHIIIVRAHPGGTFSLAMYKVDTFCCGVKDTIYRFSITRDDVDEMIDSIDDGVQFREIDYVRAHNLVYGAVEYAQEIGIEPHPDFALTQYFLQEDDEDVPLVEYEFGKDGKPTLISFDPVELDKYRKMLLKVLKPDEFDVLLIDPYGYLDEDFEEDEYYEDEDDEGEYVETSFGVEPE